MGDELRNWVVRLLLHEPPHPHGSLHPQPVGLLSPATVEHLAESLRSAQASRLLNLDARGGADAGQATASQAKRGQRLHRPPARRDRLAAHSLGGAATVGGRLRRLEYTAGDSGHGGGRNRWWAAGSWSFTVVQLNRWVGGAWRRIRVPGGAYGQPRPGDRRGLDAEGRVGSRCPRSSVPQGIGVGSPARDHAGAPPE